MTASVVRQDDSVPPLAADAQNNNLLAVVNLKAYPRSVGYASLFRTMWSMFIDSGLNQKEREISPVMSKVSSPAAVKCSPLSFSRFAPSETLPVADGVVLTSVKSLAEATTESARATAPDPSDDSSKDHQDTRLSQVAARAGRENSGLLENASKQAME